MSFNGNRIRKWLRIIHRDLGFLMAGICLIYAVSGILLNHMNGKDPAFKNVYATVQFPKGLMNEELSMLWKEKENLPVLKKVFQYDDSHFKLMLDGGIGTYDSNAGVVSYEHHSKQELVYWINKLHYNKVNGWYIMGDIFAASLIFLAISGLFMVSRKYGLSGRGMIYLLVGIAIPILFILMI
jgi:uncharacterized protein